jgi:hypothetical protein
MGCGVSLASGKGVFVGCAGSVSVGGNVTTGFSGADGSKEQAESIIERTSIDINVDPRAVALLRPCLIIAFDIRRCIRWTMLKVFAGKPFGKSEAVSGQTLAREGLFFLNI